MAVAHDFSKMVPGFDFLQGLVKNASATLPSLGQWVAPTLDPEELAKRIEELKTVQFWLEQNARMIATTVQALEVQRMTLTTLKTMNVQVADLAEAFKLKDPPPATAAAPAYPPGDATASEARGAPPSGRAARGAGTASSSAKASSGSPEAPPAATGVVDPMQWWGALTQQFTQLATQALKDGASEAAARASAPAKGASTGASSVASPAAKRGAARKASRPAGSRSEKRRA